MLLLLSLLKFYLPVKGRENTDVEKITSKKLSCALQSIVLPVVVWKNRLEISPIFVEEEERMSFYYLSVY